MKLIHLTDTHLTQPGQPLYGSFPAERLRDCVVSINADHADADLCVITGDLAHAGEPAAYAEFAEIIAELKVPVQLVVGNHDHRGRLAAQFPTLQHDEYGFVQSVIHNNSGSFIFMDSVKEGTHAGAYCEKRQHWLAQQLAQASGDVYLFMHHAPFKTGIKAMDKIGLDRQDAAKLQSLLHKHGRVKHLFFGHYHRPMHGSWAGIGFSTLRGLNHQVVLDFQEEDQYLFNHEPPAYAIVFIDDNNVIVHNHDFLDPSTRFNASTEPEWNT
jgi:3',5'-cyclic AMP phosphodiesterase CpdA